MKASNSDQLGLLATGSNGGVIENMQVDGTINLSGTTIAIIGGLLGEEINGGVIIDCAANVSINSAYKLFAGGGLVGYDAGGKIIRSHATGDIVSGSGRRVIADGLLGEASQTDHFAEIVESYATGNVIVGSGDNGHTYAGGLAGIGATISNSYATGKVTGGGLAGLGGLVGAGVTGGPTLTSVYAIGGVSASKQTGGLVGHTNMRDFNAAYWDVDTTGQSQGCGNGCGKAQGLSDAQLKSGLPAGFDPKIWGQSANINSGYPYLLANPPQ